MVDYESKSWLRVLVTLRGTVILALLPRVALATLVGVAAWLAHRHHAFKIPTTVHTMLGVALGLLLVFRTNASYDRWWEGRKLFGGMVNRLRDLVRQTSAWFPEGPARTEAQRLVALWYALLVQHLRKERDLGATGVAMSDAEKAALESVATRPVLVSRWLTELVAAQVSAGHLSDQRLFAIDQNLTAMNDYEGASERIMKTPIPFAYAHHIKAFLALFIFTAPFALAHDMGAMTPVAAFFIAYGMFGIEEIGVEIEDPFGYDPNDLPLDRIGATIAGDTKMMTEKVAHPVGFAPQNATSEKAA